jgi:hypothetical protein
MAPTDLEVTVITNLVGVALGRNPVIAAGARTGGAGPSFVLAASEARIEMERATGVLAETEQLSLPEAHARLADLTP